MLNRSAHTKTNHCYYEWHMLNHKIIFPCLNMIPTFPTMQLTHEQFGQRLGCSAVSRWGSWSCLDVWTHAKFPQSDSDRFFVPPTQQTKQKKESQQQKRDWMEEVLDLFEEIVQFDCCWHNSHSVRSAHWLIVIVLVENSNTTPRQTERDVCAQQNTWFRTDAAQNMWVVLGLSKCGAWAGGYSTNC